MTTQTAIALSVDFAGLLPNGDVGRVQGGCIRVLGFGVLWHREPLMGETPQRFYRSLHRAFGWHVTVLFPWGVA